MVDGDEAVAAAREALEVEDELGRAVDLRDPPERPPELRGRARDLVAANVIWCRFDEHWTSLAFYFALLSAGSRSAISIAMIPMTTSNSTNVNAR